MDVKKTVIEIIAEVCSLDATSISAESSIGDFPSWDSMAQLTILSSIEEKFNISFEPEEMMEMEDVSDMIKAIESKL